MDDDDEDLVHPCARCIMIFIFYFIIMVVGDMDNDDEHLAIGSHTHTHTHTAPARLPWCTLLAHWCLFLYPRRLAQVPSVCVCVCVCVSVAHACQDVFFFSHIFFFTGGAVHVLGSAPSQMFTPAAMASGLRSTGVASLDSAMTGIVGVSVCVYNCV
jgi:hypothetical protein